MNSRTNTAAEKRVVQAAMGQFYRFLKRFGSVQAMLNDTGTGDRLIKACAALDKKRKRK